MKRLQGKFAVVTGASRGIGLALARALEAEGCRLALASRHMVAGEFHGALAHACDVRDEDSVRVFFEAVRQRAGRIDLLINNAGSAHPMVNTDTLALGIWRDVLDTNLTGTFLCTRAALPLMNGGGVIVNNLSLAATQGFPQQVAYCAAKFGALGFTNALREEVRSRNIRVMALIAGATSTDIWNQFWPDAPREKMMAPETIAAAVVNAVCLPANSSVDEIRIMPAAGKL